MQSSQVTGQIQTVETDTFGQSIVKSECKWLVLMFEDQLEVVQNWSLWDEHLH